MKIYTILCSFSTPWYTNVLEFLTTQQKKMTQERITGIRERFPSELDYRNMIAATQSDFSKGSFKKKKKKKTMMALNHHQKLPRIMETTAPTVMKLPRKWYGRSSALMLIKLCCAVKAVCHKGHCESNQSLVPPLGIHQHSPCERLIVLGTEIFHGLLFVGHL